MDAKDQFNRRCLGSILPVYPSNSRHVMKPAYVVVIILGLMLCAVGVGQQNWRAAERAECEHWLDQLKQYAMWFSADWQKEQCAQYAISFIK